MNEAISTARLPPRPARDGYPGGRSRPWTEEDAAESDDGGALLDRDLVVLAHPHRELQQLLAGGEVGQRGEPPTRIPGMGRDRHEPHDVEPRTPGGVGEAGDAGRFAPCLLRL